MTTAVGAATRPTNDLPAPSDSPGAPPGLRPGGAVSTPAAAPEIVIGTRIGPRDESADAVSPRRPLRVVLIPDDMQSMHRRIPELVRRVRQELAPRHDDAHDDAPRPVIVDLSELPTLGVAACAQLRLLVGLLHELVAAPGPAVVGVPSTLRPCLADGLPDGVRLVDRRGRQWAG